MHTHPHARQILPTHFYTRTRNHSHSLSCGHRSHFCNAAGTCNRDAGIFLSLEDAGKTEDVRGLDEEAAHDGRPQRPLCGPDACP